MSLVTGVIHCTICQRLSGAMEDCSTVRGQQHGTLCRQRCRMSASIRMFGSLWNAVAAQEHRRQDGSRRPGMVVKCQTVTGVRVWPPWSRRAVQRPVQLTEHRRYVVKASAASNLTGGSVLNRLQPVHQSFRDAEEQQVTVVQAAGNECLD